MRKTKRVTLLGISILLGSAITIFGFVYYLDEVRNSRRDGIGLSSTELPSNIIATVDDHSVGDPDISTQKDIDPILKFQSTEVKYESFEDLKPFDLYLKNINAANEGDPRSQFIVASALEYCAGSAKDISDLDRARGNVPAAVIDKIEKVLVQCGPLHTQFDDIWLESQYWQHLASESAFPLAKAKEATGPFSEAPGHEVRQQLVEAVKSSIGDQLLEGDAFSYIVAYFANSEPDKSRYLEREAWTLLYCEKNFRCPLQTHLHEYVVKQYMRHDIDEIVTLANRYKSAIEEERWDDLNL